MLEVRGAYKGLVGKSPGKRLLGRPRQRWQDNVKMYLKTNKIEIFHWIHLTEDNIHLWALVIMVVNIWAP
jgi:hypothetical protein